MGYYRKFDTVGIVELNEWYVLDLRLKEYDSEGNPTEDSSGTSTSFGNTSGMNYYVNAVPSRGMSNVTLESSNDTFDKSVIENNLDVYKRQVMSFAEMDAMMYKIEGEDLYLIGTSEHSMIGKFIDTIIPEEELPKTLTSYSPCFRKEKGAHGLEERGVYRIHQFERCV